jgi:hypothetical protein
VLCCAVMCFAVLCDAARMLCCAVLCCAMLWCRHNGPPNARSLRMSMARSRVRSRGSPGAASVSDIAQVQSPGTSADIRPWLSSVSRSSQPLTVDWPACAATSPSRRASWTPDWDCMHRASAPARPASTTWPSPTASCGGYVDCRGLAMSPAHEPIIRASSWRGSNASANCATPQRF